MKKMLRSILLSIMLACSAFAVQASTTYVFDFTSNDATYAMDGYLVVDDTQNSLGSFNILNISGEVFGPGGGSITGLINNPNQPNATSNFGFVYDNVFSLNNNGVVFSVGAGSKWNLFQEGQGYRLYSWSGEHPFNGIADSTGTFSATLMNVSPVPEPETYAMMIAGLGLLGAVARRRKQKAVA